VFVLIFELPFTSMTEIQNARGIMDVLAEMLNALDPGNREVHFPILGVVKKLVIYLICQAILKSTIFYFVF
jgi:hypothetical protein